MKKLYLLTAVLLITAGNACAMDRKKVNFDPNTKEDTTKPFSRPEEYTNKYIQCLDGMDALQNNPLTRDSEREVEALYASYSALKTAWLSPYKPINLEIKESDMTTMPTRMGDTARIVNQKYNTAVDNAIKSLNIGEAYDYLFAWINLLRTHLKSQDAPNYLENIDQYHQAIAMQYGKHKDTVRISKGSMIALDTELANLRTALVNKNNNNK